VLIDQTVRWDGTGPKAKRIVEPPSPEKLKIIKEMIAGVIGFQADRGDQLIVESLPFESTLNQEPPVAGLVVPAAPGSQYPLVLPLWLRQSGTMTVAAGGVLALLIFAGLIVLLRRRKRSLVVVDEAAKGIGPNAGSTREDGQEQMKQHLEAKIAENERLKELQQLEALHALQLPPVKTQKAEVLTKHLSAETKKDPQAMAHVLRAWLTER
jgi:flagellar M-ring protein FliF